LGWSKESIGGAEAILLSVPIDGKEEVMRLEGGCIRVERGGEDEGWSDNGPKRV
jgi:hypothetical protein